MRARTPSRTIRLSSARKTLIVPGGCASLWSIYPVLAYRVRARQRAGTYSTGGGRHTRPPGQAPSSAAEDTGHHHPERRIVAGADRATGSLAQRCAPAVTGHPLIAGGGKRTLHSPSARLTGGGKHTPDWPGSTLAGLGRLDQGWQ